MPHVTTLLTGVFVALWRAGRATTNETYDLTNIGTLFAFALVCIGVLVLRYTDPERPRPFRVPFVWPVRLVGAAACLYDDARPADQGVGAIRLVARDRPRALLRLRVAELDAAAGRGSGNGVTQ